MWNSDASILSTCSRSATIRVPFQTSLPRTRRIRGVFRVLLCSRIGGISIGQKQKWSDIHSNEQNKILWLNWFVEAPGLRYFSQIVAIHHGIHPPSRGQLQQLRKSSFLYSAYRYSAIPFDFEREVFVVSTNLNRWLAYCNSNAKDVTSIQHTAIQQSQIFLNGEGLFNNSMVDFTYLCQIPGNDSMSAFRSFVSSRIFKLPNFAPW